MKQAHKIAGLHKPSKMGLREGSCIAHYLSCLSWVLRGPDPRLVQVAALWPQIRLVKDRYIMSPVVSRHESEMHLMQVKTDALMGMSGQIDAGTTRAASLA